MKDFLIRVVSVLLVLALGVWLMSVTEWVDTEKAMPARGEALTNPLYGTQALLRELGVQVVRQQSLERLPPRDGLLVLVSHHWDLFPERARQLRDWVEGGGHLVIPSSFVGQPSFEDWLPVMAVDVPKTAPDPSRAKEAQPEDWRCRLLTELHASPAADGRVGAHGFLVCGEHIHSQYQPSEGALSPLWSAQGTRGVEALRMPVGQGSVTVLGAWALLDNQSLLKGDNALFAVTALQARVGTEVWFVAEETREPVWPWLWRHAWVAWGLWLWVLALALWRAAPRFGPLALPAGVHRRSIAEQVRGTGHFLLRHGAGPLHAAQVRALAQAVVKHLRPRASDDTPQRMAMLAHAVGLDADALAQAHGRLVRKPASMAADLELLETARRRLVALPSAERF